MILEIWRSSLYNQGDIISYPAGVRYWFAGCMAIVGESYVFVPVNTFSIENPADSQSKYCHNIFKQNPATIPEPDDFCKNTKIKVHVHDGLSDKAPDNVRVSMVQKTSSGLQGAVTKGTDDSGVSEIAIASNGEYILSVEADDHMRDEVSMKVDCNPENCGAW